MRRVAFAAALAGALALTAGPATAAPTSVGYTTFTAGYCNGSAEAGAYSYGKTTARFPSSSCRVVQVRTVYRPKGTLLTVYGAWRYLYPSTSVDSNVSVTASIDTSKYQLLRTHHQIEDRRGYVNQRTCYPSASCVGGLK